MKILALNDDSVDVEKQVVDAVPMFIGRPKGALNAPMGDDEAYIEKRFIDLIPKFIGSTADAAGKVVDLVHKIKNDG